MIRNIIFDMGNVLIRWDPAYFVLRSGVTNPEERRLLMREIFESEQWPLLDRGVSNEQALAELACSRLPEHLHETARNLIFQWNRPVEPIPGMKEFIADCKKAGLGIYLLSNASYRQPEYWAEIPGSEYFDGTIISAYQGCVKPSAEIYNRLLDLFSLKAEECYFIDDVPENIDGAKKAGIDGFVFRGDAKALREAVAEFVPALKAASDK